MNFEICTDSVEGAVAAGKFGAKRIELCSALSVGGLTPSYGLIKQCVEKSTVEVHVIVRHKEGDFNYNDEDVELMKIDIEASKKAGAHGVVFGILDENNEISIKNKELVIFSKSLGLEVTFHRAFDFVPNYKSISEKSYPFTTEVYVAIRKGLDSHGSALRLRDWLLTEEGQAVVKESGYAPIPSETGVQGRQLSDQ